MTPLDTELRALIAAEGPIGVDRFMAVALGHPVHGYYVTRDPFGAAGDFVTAPEISQMFGELCGLWAAHAWARLGSPDPVMLAELGPGRGTLMADALRAVTRAAPAFTTALRLHLVETSPVLRERQAAALAAHDPTWHADPGTVPDGPLIVVANEFFDALPIRQFVRRSEGWFERLVGLDQNALAFGLSPRPAELPLPAAPEGSVFELGETGLGLLSGLAHRMAASGGAALVIDYGHLQSGFGDTLQAVAGHRPVDPLADVGEADLTAHVDFAALAGAATAAGMAVDLMATQADFLEALGIRTLSHRLGARATPEQAAAIAGSLERLTDRSPRGMGTLFKVLALHADG